MTEPRKEGAGRPLYTSAPQTRPEPPAAPYLWAAAASYPLAYLYTRGILLYNGFAGWQVPAFAAACIAAVEVLARALGRRHAPEAGLWAACWFTLSAALWAYGEQPALAGWQVLVWHLFAVWYVLARCGMLAQGHSGSLCFLDALAGLITLPFGSFFKRIGALAAGARALLHHRFRLRQAAVAALTAAVTLGLCAAAWPLLAAADANFAAVGRRLMQWMFGWVDGGSLLQTVLAFVLSLPVGAWLYGLVAGSLQRQTPPCPADRFWARLRPLQKLPAVTANVAVGALCALYLLFFALQAAAWLAAAPLGLTAPQAAGFAVDGFWELLRILLLDLAVLAAVRFLGRAPLPRALAALFCGCGLAFAGLAAAKLAVYIHLHGFTPRRVVAGWFLGVLAVWAVLLLVRVFRPIPAARIGIVVLAVSFTLLACVNVKQRIVQANIARYAAGQDAELDTDVLQACGFAPWERERAHCLGYTVDLINAGWFDARPLEDVRQLYELTASFDRVYYADVDGHTRLRLTFDETWRCVAADLT